MSALLRCTLAAALATLNAAPAMAEPLQRVEIVAPRTATTAQVMAQLDALTKFRMSSGRQMTVAVVAEDRLRVQYGRHLRALLTADGRGNFVSSDGSVRLGFDMAEVGDIRQVRLSVPADRL